ncbi:hypothetical protein [Caminicella sporogenes]|uniref:hypothetical protein n=1 Tax=Caminicella sporogenes TaxID=166485 RepID=UPI00254023A0|nr:hypothetical protein [Caminicella sporogenes]WIF94208.1 hypothetical protein QNI18_07800 [Caminicella sporogenes]
MKKNIFIILLCIIITTIIIWINNIENNKKLDSNMEKINQIIHKNLPKYTIDINSGEIKFYIYNQTRSDFIKKINDVENIYKVDLAFKAIDPFNNVYPFRIDEITFKIIDKNKIIFMTIDEQNDSLIKNKFTLEVLNIYLKYYGKNIAGNYTETKVEYDSNLRAGVGEVDENTFTIIPLKDFNILKDKLIKFQIKPLKDIENT